MPSVPRWVRAKWPTCFENCAGAVTGRSWTSCTFVAHAVPGRRLCSGTAGAVPSRISASTARWCDRASGATWVPAVIISETTASLATILYAWASASSEYWHIPVVGAYFKKQSGRDETQRRFSAERRIRVWRRAVRCQMQTCSWQVFCVSSVRSAFAAERLGKAQGAVGVAVTLATLFCSDRWLLVWPIGASSGVLHLRGDQLSPLS
jgi:hypothetical protein